ncbi:MAG: GGDEF domain-containing protein, partial [Candidatus Thiodiazotropha sp.]
LNQLKYMLSQVSRASYDVLTGTLTRRAGIEVLDLQFRLAAMSEASLSILYFDLDNFKSINDTFGHEAGDGVLKQAAQQIGRTVRKGDSVIRWGGEEFIVVLPTADPAEANDVIQRIMNAGLGERPDGAPVTASIGVSEVQEDKLGDWKAQVELADHRMYKAKTSGRARSIGVNSEPLLWPNVATS